MADVASKLVSRGRLKRVAHPFASSAKGWVIALCATALAIPFVPLTAQSCEAQTASCGLTSMVAAADPQYPPIARAAHVQGTVVMMASFEKEGRVDTVRVLSGPTILQSSAVAYAKSWTANEYGGPRECPLALTFVFDDSIYPQQTIAKRLDLQHVYVKTLSPPCLCDPGGVLETRHHFLFIPWTSTSV
jgi:hypothetical protein